jgi:hypothetical protein
MARACELLTRIIYNTRLHLHVGLCPFAITTPHANGRRFLHNCSTNEANHPHFAPRPSSMILIVRKKISKSSPGDMFLM